MVTWLDSSSRESAHRDMDTSWENQNGGQEIVVLRLNTGLAPTELVLVIHLYRYYKVEPARMRSPTFSQTTGRLLMITDKERAYIYQVSTMTKKKKFH